MGKTAEAILPKGPSVTQMGDMLAKYRCGYMSRADLESAAGKPLRKIEFQVRRVNFMRILERR